MAEDETIRQRHWLNGHEFHKMMDDREPDVLHSMESKSRTRLRD